MARRNGSHTRRLQDDADKQSQEKLFQNTVHNHNRSLRADNDNALSVDAVSLNEESS